jgi:hypothetical protein
MKNYEVISANFREQGENTRYSAILSVPNTKVKNVSVVMKDDGEVVAYPPQEKYTAKVDGQDVVKYNRVVVFRDAKAMNAAADALVKNPTSDIRLLQTPFDIKGGKRLGYATLTGDVTLNVIVMVYKDGTKNLYIPREKYQDQEGKDQAVIFVKPISGETDEEYKAEKEALIDAILAVATPAEQKGE